MAKTSRLAWATDYREPVKVLKVERKPNHSRKDKGAYLVQRANGETTSNYPGYLLEWAD